MDGHGGFLHVFAINFGMDGMGPAAVSHLCTAPQMLLEELIVGLKVLQEAAASQTAGGFNLFQAS